MIKTVHQMPVSDVFSINSNTLYRIPKYQREYTWGKSEWEALFNDVMENEKGYFLGSYICVSSSALNGTTLEVIDGQQRFTSLTLLMAVLYEKLNALKDTLEDDDRGYITNLRKELAVRSEGNSSTGKRYDQRLFPQKQNRNDEDYRHVLLSKGIITGIDETPANFGNRRISKAEKCFAKLVDEKVTEIHNEKPSETVAEILLEILGKFNAAVLVGIEVDSNKDAYMLFESLNHRGVPLSALDLIKNTLIAKAPDEASADECYEQWKKILRYIGQDDYSVQERFFRQYYNAFRDDLNKPFPVTGKTTYYLGYLATKTTLLDIYEKMIKHDYSALLEDLGEKAKYYSILLNLSEETYTYSDSLKELERISGAPSYILLMFLLVNKDALGISDDQIREIVELLIIFFVRRNITDVPNTRRLTQLFIDIISNIRALSGNSVSDEVRRMLMEVSAPDEMFTDKLRGPVYDDNPDATRFILCSIEAKHQTKEIYSNLWSRDKNNKYIWTIEHIFPEGQNIPTAWVQMIASGNTAQAKQYHDQYVHTLGNLTITGYNQNLSNMPFELKRDRTSRDKTKVMGYRNGLFLNSDLVTEDTWTVEKIQARTEKIIGMLLDMYKW